MIFNLSLKNRLTSVFAGQHPWQHMVDGSANLPAMNWFALAPSSEPAETPLSLFVAVYSTVVMITVFLSNFLVYLLRDRIEPVNRFLQGVLDKEYLKHIQGPAAAALVAAVSGYGINMLTGDSPWGWVGLILALPIPLVMVTWNGIRMCRQSEFEREWPHVIVPAGDPVKIRSTLRKVSLKSADLRNADLPLLNTVLTSLLDDLLPALQARHDRSLIRWLRDHSGITTAVVAWAVFTLAAVTLAALPQPSEGRTGAILVLGGFVVVVLSTGAGLLGVLRGRSRYQTRKLLEEVKATAGGIRRRMTEHRLGLVRYRS
ncbi:hypothetical protein GA0070616_0843 [Micromonospora nigra]|uniref:Uncharacterized protein n=1 Tax=Micromonospora nigra TaxID=145857 RepID=A0A1C6RFD9_9ACTN|nr:hypothetical protein [Micromonospora nigra]SCL15827.1 hypothetical protein GA0070616_0843 [Micromonospora nigra]